VREADAHYRQCSENQQPGISAPRTDPVAQPADQQPRKNRKRHGRDDGVSNLLLGQVQFVANDWHERRDAEPAKKA
jgi:hypothetical protein